MHGEEILVVGTRSPQSTDEFFDEFMYMNNEQVNALRKAMKDRSSIERLYEDLTALNNDMATLQRSLQKKNRELERLNEQKNQFVGMAAHDLRSPLSSFFSLCELMLSEIGEGQENWRELLEEMKRSSRSMLGLVNDLLDITKIESGKLDLRFDSVDLNRLIERNVSINRALAERKGISLSLQTPEDRVFVEIDPGKTDQVLNNLISNAVKYSDHGDAVTVVVRILEEQFEIAVVDQGQGIPADEIGKLFKPFGRTSVRSTAGEISTGLGLLICRKIVEGHGGRIWVESREGEGSTFRFTMPRSRP
jgi:signal transduction histidine kinase